jgi:SNF2 family DNA or RNA helicase
MTGAPTPQAPTDAWAQVKMLLPDRLNGKGFVRFREEVMIKAGPFRWVPRRDSAEVVHALMQPSVRYTLEDVAELPELVIQPLPVELGPIQADIYEKLTKHSFAMVESGAIAPMNEAVLIGKLTQVALGWVYTSNRGITHLDPAPRIQAMLDILAGARAKVIVFVPYTHALQGVADEVDKAGFSVAVVDGSVSKAQRDTIFNQFQNTGDPRVIVAHPACMSHGLTLTAADTIIWFGPTDSLETFEQANARITRVGQHRKQLVVLLEGTPVERKAYRRLRDKKAMQGLLLELHAEQTRRSATP